MHPIRLLLPAFLLLPALAHAQIDRVEHRLGATNLSAQSGNGGLTVGVAPTGEITVLSWPSPSYHDQVEYRTAAGPDARTLPRLGADTSDGVFGGLWVETDGEAPALTWFRDAPWTHEQAYASPTSATIVHRARHAALGLKVTEWTFVDADRDVLVRRVRVERSPDSPVLAAWSLLYENFAPSTSEPEDLTLAPLPDDRRNDFAAYWDPSAGRLLHFRPADPRALASTLDPVLAGDWAAAPWETEGLPAMQALLPTLGGGSWLALGATVAPSGVHVGTEFDTTCDDDDGWSWRPVSAFARAAHPTIRSLISSPVAGCDANAVLAWPLAFAPLLDAEAADLDVFVGLGATHAEAVSRLEDARAEGFDAAMLRTDAAAADFLAGLVLPTGFGPDESEVLHFARRWALSLRQGTDRDTAAIVASIATQPSYHLDWPRDSAFFDLALDVAGRWEQVSQHQQFLVATQNLEPVLGGSVDAPTLASPPGAWLMHFYAEGTPATLLVNRFEIDQVGLMLWDFWRHALYAPNDAKARATLAATWPAIRRSANLLTACVDDLHPAAVAVSGRVPTGFPAWWPVLTDLEAGLLPDAAAAYAAGAAGVWSALRPCLAVEDDNLVDSVSLYSAHVTRLGLLSAVRAAHALCVEDPVVQAWQDRADELGAAAFSLWYDEDDATWTGRGDWLLWPEPLDLAARWHPLFSDAATEEDRANEVAAYVRAALDAYAATAHREVDDAVGLRTEGAAYENKKTLSLARYYRTVGADRLLVGQNREHIRRLAVDLPMRGTRHVGEVFVTLDSDGDGVGDSVEQRVAQPHLWAATLTYLSAMAVANPELIARAEADALDLDCPTGEEPQLQRQAPACGADCASSVGGKVGGGALVLLLPLVLRRRRCERITASASHVPPRSSGPTASQAQPCPAMSSSSPLASSSSPSGASTGLPASSKIQSAKVSIRVFPPRSKRQSPSPNVWIPTTVGGSPSKNTGPPESPEQPPPSSGVTMK